ASRSSGGSRRFSRGGVDGAEERPPSDAAKTRRTSRLALFAPLPPIVVQDRPKGPDGEDIARRDSRHSEQIVAGPARLLTPPHTVGRMEDRAAIANHEDVADGPRLGYHDARSAKRDRDPAGLKRSPFRAVVLQGSSCRAQDVHVGRRQGPDEEEIVRAAAALRSPACGIVVEDRSP